jgi:hypothetical protein
VTEQRVDEILNGWSLGKLAFKTFCWTLSASVQWCGKGFGLVIGLVLAARLLGVPL